MNEELLSNMKFIPESCDLDLGDIQELSFKHNNVKDDIENAIYKVNMYKKCNCSVTCEFKLTDEGISTLFDEIHKNTSIVISRTPWGGTLSMSYEVVKKLYPKKYREIVIKAERNYLDRLNESEDNTNV